MKARWWVGEGRVSALAEHHPDGAAAAGGEDVDVDADRVLHHAAGAGRERHHDAQQIGDGSPLPGQQALAHGVEHAVAGPHIGRGEGGAADEIGQFQKGIAFAHWATPHTGTNRAFPERQAARAAWPKFVAPYPCMARHAMLLSLRRLHMVVAWSRSPKPMKRAR